MFNLGFTPRYLAPLTMHSATATGPTASRVSRTSSTVSAEREGAASNSASACEPFGPSKLPASLRRRYRRGVYAYVGSPGSVENYSESRFFLAHVMNPRT